MTSEIKVPFLGEGIDKVTVSLWHRKPGDKVVADEDIVEVEADKAIFNIPSVSNGTLKKILVSEGQEVAIGQCLAIIEDA